MSQILAGGRLFEPVMCAAETFIRFTVDRREKQPLTLAELAKARDYRLLQTQLAAARATWSPCVMPGWPALPTQNYP
jgi:hypothetical protein